ncbi:ATP-binding protein [Cytobacillus kochii]|uniref:ATP-binding protein n=1 Tax=Cytobacillus kochii TaxID=859143 RepID=UPI001CD2856A|nr:ATP-binding protein [Cytobacillus kochii]MCA1029317.1 ATP-binding protein [Cytobacillus kochii]
MERIQMPQRLQKNITFLSEECHKHTYRKGGQDVINPVTKMKINGKVVCPRCEVERENELIQKAEQEKYERHLEELKNRNKSPRIFHDKSIITDMTITRATFDNYLADCREESINKESMLEVLRRYTDGEVFNVILQGNPGAGKSHLAYALMKSINETGEYSCLYISVDEMLSRIRDSFSNRESIYTQSYLVDLMSNVDFLVLDDLGAETGAIDTDKTATDFTHKVLYSVTSKRQDKATVLTTNLSSTQLFKLYDKKLVSRLMKNPKYIVFKEAKDKRMANIPF